ncbi:MAG: energy transducer TonB [Pyrinomonadaceae bacterium]|nr:energy transducer TonB [Pyrinomonadaceae bacterium]
MRAAIVFVILLFMCSFSFGQETEPLIISAPVYEPPAEAIAAGIDGTILVYTKVNERGEVTETKVLGGPQWPCEGRTSMNLINDVRKGAESAVQLAKFKPATKAGHAVESVTGVRIWFGQAYEELKKKRAAEGKPEPAVINGGVVDGRALSLPKPAYPVLARANRAQGTLKVSILIDENGKVIAAGTENGHPLLHESARDAACKARFSPTLVEGKPVRVSGVLTYHYVAP